MCSIWFCTGEILPNTAIDSYRRVEHNGWRKGSHLTVCILTTGKLLIRYHTYETDEED